MFTRVPFTTTQCRYAWTDCSMVTQSKIRSLSMQMFRYTTSCTTHFIEHTHSNVFLSLIAVCVRLRALYLLFLVYLNVDVCLCFHRDCIALYRPHSPLDLSTFTHSTKKNNRISVTSSRASVRNCKQNRLWRGSVFERRAGHKLGKFTENYR